LVGWYSDFTTLRRRTEMVLETLVCSPFNHSTQLITRKNFTDIIMLFPMLVKFNQNLIIAV
jgi:hypothetical protein